MIWPGCSLFSRSSLTGPHVSVWRLFFQLSELSETCPWNRQISWPVDFHASSLADQIRMSSSGYVNVFQWNRERFFFRWVMFELWVQRDGGTWSFLSWTKNHSSLHHPETSREVVERPFWFSKKTDVTFSLNWSLRIEVECSQFLFSSKGFDLSTCDWKKFPFFFGKHHLFRIESFLSRFPTRP